MSRTATEFKQVTVDTRCSPPRILGTSVRKHARRVAERRNRRIGRYDAARDGYFKSHTQVIRPAVTPKPGILTRALRMLGIRRKAT